LGLRRAWDVGEALLDERTSLAVDRVLRAGAVFYVEWPNPWPGRFGFHEVWHLLVLAGSSAHFLAALALV